ncbi:metallophosphatase family protein [Candidatus Woesearchaeota archaeon]|nr:metallophosphatase family protein [Candidatus Woesearchaeota archaeon]
MPNDQNKQQILLLAKLAEDLKIELDADVKEIVDKVKPLTTAPSKGVKYAIMSDIHANIQAFQAVMEDVRKQGVKNIIFLGDLIGYGGNPNECVELMINSRPFVWIRGNHDQAVVLAPYGFTFYAATSINWTKTVLESKYFVVLEQLPLKDTIKESNSSIVFTHGCPGSNDDNIDTYIDIKVRRSAYLPNYAFERMEEKQLAFIGHIHEPFISILKKDKQEDFNENKLPESLSLDFNQEEINKVLINVGSVGQPRGSDRRACYVIFTEYGNNIYDISFRRVSYDIKDAQKAIKKYWKEYCQKEADEGNEDFKEHINDFYLADRLG